VIEESETYRQDRLSAALLAAWATSVAASFFASCIFNAMSVKSPSGLPDWSLPGFFSGILWISFIVAMVSAPVAFIATFVVALPIFRYLIRQKALTAASSIVAGVAIAGLLCIILLVAKRLTGFLDLDFDLAVTVIAAAGPVSGLVVWFVMRQRKALST
jgi:hypothetical protein